MKKLDQIRQESKEIKEKIDDTEERLRQLKNQEKKILKQDIVKRKKERTHRLITRGAILESLIENAKEELTKPFEKADELKNKTLRLAEINKLLDLGDVNEIENNSPLLEDFKRTIIDYANYEFSEDNPYEAFDKLYPDLEHISLAFTHTPDDKHTIQYEINAENKSWTQYVDDMPI
ncbi:PF12958 family protein, partial [Peptoniphilus sp. BV3C26]